MDLGSAPTPMKNSGYTTVSLCAQKVDMCYQPEKDSDMCAQKVDMCYQPEKDTDMLCI